MKRNIRGLLGSFAVVVLIVGLAWYAGRGSGRRRNHQAAPPPVERIEAMSPKPRDFSVLNRWFGKVQSKQAVSLMALESGRIVSVDAPDEASVKEGTLLFTFGGPRVRSRSRILQARIASLRRRVSLAEQTAALKQEAVAQRITKREELLSAKNSLARLRTRLGDAEQELSSFQERLRVRAPLDGVVTGRRVNVGQEVEKGDVLAQLIPPESLRIVATLYPPDNIPLMGLPAVVERDGGKAVSARVTKVRPRRTLQGATVIWIEGDGVNRYFAPGEGVSGYIVVSLHQNAPAVPVSAVVRDERGRSFVFLKTPQGYRKQAVRTGAVSDGWVEIMEGVGRTDKVVVRGAYELFYRDFNKIYKVED